MRGISVRVWGMGGGQFEMATVVVGIMRTIMMMVIYDNIYCARFSYSKAKLCLGYATLPRQWWHSHVFFIGGDEFTPPPSPHLRVRPCVKAIVI